MCGQLGYSGTKPFDIEKIKLLTLWNSLERGEDATGFYSPLNGHNRTLHKGSDVVIHDNFKLIPDTILMAHVRAKTIGLNTIENTHPFKRGDWYLQHNGTLRNHLDLAHKYELSTIEYSVDSDIICGAISKQDNTSVLKEIDGPAAIIMHKTTMPNKLFVFRNTERPLFRGMIDGCMYISSIKESLVYIGCNSIKEFKVDTLYTICDGVIEKSIKITNTPYNRPFVNTYNNYNYNNYGYHNNLNPNELVNSWLRANFNDTSHTRKFKLIQNEFYFICGVTEFGMLEVKQKDENNAPVETYHKSYFNTNDYLEIWDSAVALYDIIDDKKQVVINNNQVVLIAKVKDNILSLENPNTHKDICNADRRYFRAATDLEIRLSKTNNLAVNDSTTESYTEGYYEAYDDYRYDSYNTSTSVNNHPIVKDTIKHNTTPIVNEHDIDDVDDEIDFEDVITNTDRFFTDLDVELQLILTTLSKGNCDDTHDICQKIRELKTNAETMHYQLLTMDQKL